MKPAAIGKLWQLQPGLCPCDLDFVNYLRARGITGQRIFHFGSGGHHLVGRENSMSSPNYILGITASCAEYMAYSSIVSNRPQIARHYKVILGDIYDLNFLLLPMFDIVTLFHLCEYYWSDDKYQPMLDDYRLLGSFLSIIKANGMVIFYRGSDHYERAREIIDVYKQTRQIELFEESRSLIVYRRTNAGH